MEEKINTQLKRKKCAVKTNAWISIESLILLKAISYVYVCRWLPTAFALNWMIWEINRTALRATCRIWFYSRAIGDHGCLRVQVIWSGHQDRVIWPTYTSSCGVNKSDMENPKFQMGYTQRSHGVHLNVIIFIT